MESVWDSDLLESDLVEQVGNTLALKTRVHGDIDQLHYGRVRFQRLQLSSQLASREVANLGIRKVSIRQVHNHLRTNKTQH